MTDMPTDPTEQLLAIMQRLRDPDTGCPWDQKQTFDTIIPHTIEETYEVVDAIVNRDWPNLQEELGDLLFQIIFYSQLAKEQNLFEFVDVVKTVNEKLIRRHPHVFAGKTLTDEEIKAQWQQIKAQEKAAKGIKAAPSVLDSVPRSLPALSVANQLQQCCAKFGFDWDEITPVIAKVREEISEVEEEIQALKSDEAQSASNEPKVDKLEEELGDLLFATVNLVRHLGKDPEVALAKANAKFSRRFRGVEALAAESGGELADYSLEQLDGFWEAVKRSERIL